MLVQSILDLIENLKKEEELTEQYRDFCKKLEQRFAKLKPANELSSEEVNFVFNCYHELLQSHDNAAMLTSVSPLNQKDYWKVFIQELSEQKDHKLEELPSQKQKVHPCWLFLMYLLNTRFDVSMFDIKTISLWDKENKVCTANANLYGRLFPYIKTDQRELLERTYETLLHEKMIQEELFLQKKIYWFEPEILLATLARVFDIDLKVTKFLDQLIQTYAQEKGELIKSLRVNLLFNEMISGLDSTLQEKILHGLANHKDKSDKECFIVNGMNYINKRLGQLESTTHSKDCTFFSRTYKRVKIPLCEESVTFSAVINHFKEKLKQYEHKPEYSLDRSDSSTLDPSVYDKLSKYLRDLSHPILTVDEKAQASSSANTSDYLGLRT